MKGTLCVLAALVALFGWVAAFDDELNGQCVDWILANQKDMIILNQVAGHSHIASCAQYCMIAGSGFRSDTTTCKLLCDMAGGYKKFSAALNLEGGFANPEEMCKTMFRRADKDDDDEDGAVGLLELDQTGAERKVGIRGDLTIQGTLATSVLTSPIGDVKVSGELHVQNGIEASSASGAFLKAGSTVSVKQGIVSKKEQLLVKGKIDADSVTTGGDLRYSFLEVDGVRQWSFHVLDDFEISRDGWSHGQVTECGGHHVLGGHCVDLELPEVTKTYRLLPPHSQVRIVAKFLFIDSWDGESAFLKVDGNTVWVESYNHAASDPAHGINVCGNETPEGKLAVPIDVTVPHTGRVVTLSFGATTDEGSCDESFAIDTVMIFTR